MGDPILVRDIYPQAPDPIRDSELVTKEQIEEYLKPIREKLELHARDIDIAKAKAEQAHTAILPKLDREPGHEPKVFEDYPEAWRNEGRFAFTASRDAEFGMDQVQIVIRKNFYYDVPARVWRELLARGVI